MYIRYKDIILLYIMEITVERFNNGKYNLNTISNDQYIGNTLKQGYEWDGWMRYDVEKYYKPCTDIIDIGANIGYNTLMFSDYGPVHTFEPVYYQIVDMNVKSNTLKSNVFIYAHALSDTEYDTKMYIPERGCQYENKINYGGTSLNKHETLGNQEINVNCR